MCWPHAMGSAPDLLVFEELAGLVSIAPLRGADGAVTGARIAAPLPLELSAEVPPATIAACIGLAPADIVSTTHAPVIASVGIGFVIAEIAGIDALGRAAPEPGALRAAASHYPAASGFKLLLHAPAGTGAGTGGTTRRLRMFAPDRRGGGPRHRQRRRGARRAADPRNAGRAGRAGLHLRAGHRDGLRAAS